MDDVDLDAFIFDLARPYQPAPFRRLHSKTISSRSYERGCRAMIPPPQPVNTSYDKLARQCAAEGAGHVRYLVRLAELELIDRERRMVERRIRQARFPAVKSLDSFDFKAIPSLNKMLVVELARCEYVERRENIIALGNSGTGKTHIALGLGLAACQKGLSVGFTTAAALVHELMEARDEKRPAALPEAVG